MKSVALPDSWASDSLSDYMNAFHRNCVSHFANRQQEFRHLLDIDTQYRKAIDKFVGEDDECCSSFLLRSHAAFLAGATLTLAGALADAPMVLRGSLESALYALHCHKQPHAFSVWCARDADAASKKEARDEFTVRKVMDTLKAEAPGLHSSAQKLYQTTVDFGGHPNIGALAHSFEIQVSRGSRYYGLDYLTGNTFAVSVMLKLCSEIGICSLVILGKAIPHTFAGQGIESTLKPLADAVLKLARESLETKHGSQEQD